nr:uncharacterized protein LOC109163262 [Ipomoea batatas]
MSSSSAASYQRPSPTSGRLRKSVTWLFVALLIIYVVYSAKIILIKDSPPTKCSYVDNNNNNNHNLVKENRLSTTNDAANPPPPSPPASEEEEEEEPPPPKKKPSFRDDTEVKHVVFGIAASANLWEKRKEYIQVWWRPQETRGAVWLDKAIDVQNSDELPQIRVSGDTSRFNYTNRQGDRSALRISRVVSETLRLGLEDVRWFVMGDDDTVFFVDNVVRVLNKYDHTQYYYIGSSSESHIQNIFFSYSMAYGGGGFAISYPLAVELEKMQDRCISRYPGLYGSDDRIQACMAELGVPITREPGFHQFDVYGNLLGLLGSHPVSPLVSVHHLDVVAPIFPDMTRVESLRQLFESVKLDSGSVMQQSICYDKQRYWSISVSWGYVIQVIRGMISPRELEMPTRTFLNWYKRADYMAYAFNTRPVTRHPCQKPFIYYVNKVRLDRSRNQIIGIYYRHREPYPYCRWRADSPENIDSIVVLKEPDTGRWERSPRRDCCRVLPSRQNARNLYLWVGSCREGEVSEF